MHRAVQHNKLNSKSHWPLGWGARLFTHWPACVPSVFQEVSFCSEAPTLHRMLHAACCKAHNVQEIGIAVVVNASIILRAHSAVALTRLLLLLWLPLLLLPDSQFGC